MNTRMSCRVRSSVQWLTSFTVTILALACAGCGRTPNQVHFVVADNYAGSFYIELDDEDGVELTQSDGRYLVAIPESGILKMKGANPFTSYLYTAAFANGKPIWVSKKWGDNPAPGEFGMWSVGTSTGGERNGKIINHFYWFVGTEAEWKATDGQTRYKLGGVNK